MTRISFHTDAQGALTELTLRGHANFAESGKDILCAGISTLTNFLLRTLYTYRPGAYSLQMDPETADLVICFDPPVQVGPLQVDPVTVGTVSGEATTDRGKQEPANFPIGAFLDLWEGEVRAMASEYPDFMSVEPKEDPDSSDQEEK